MNVRFDTITNADGTVYDRTNRDGNWQVIFKTVSGLDYCRETRPSSHSRDAIKAWAEEQVRVYRLGGAVIERW
jgi:hypothetical protein